MDGDECRPLLRMNLSFAGCGFLAIYHLGVAKALMMHGRKFLMNVQRFAGASAGALVAAALAVRDSDLKALEVFLLLKFIQSLSDVTENISIVMRFLHFVMLCICVTTCSAW